MSARAPLTRDRILRAALVLIDRDGLDALTMRALGAALGVEGMALYRHVGSKERLLDGIAELLVSELGRPPAGAPAPPGVGSRVWSSRRPAPRCGRRRGWRSLAPTGASRSTTPSPSDC